MKRHRKEIKIGIVGLQVGHWHAEILRKMKDVTIVSIADRNPHGMLPSAGKTIRQYAGELGADLFTEGVDLITRSDIDALHICTPPAEREELLIAAGKKGIPVLLEKPLACDLLTAQRYKKIIDTYSIPLMMEYPLRYQPALAVLKKLLTNDRLGPPVLITGDVQMDMYPHRDHWAWDQHIGNGLVNENGGHLIDTLCYLCGNPARMRAYGGNLLKKAATEDAAGVVMEFQSGAVATMTLGGLSAKPLGVPLWLNVATGKGQALLTGSQFVFNNITWGFRNNGGKAHTKTWDIIPVPDKIKYAIRHFIECVAGDTMPSCDSTDGIRVQRVLEGIKRSIHTGKEIVF